MSSPPTAHAPAVVPATTPLSKTDCSKESFAQWISTQNFGYLALAILLTMAIQSITQHVYSDVLQPVINSVTHRKRASGTAGKTPEPVVYHVQWQVFMLHLAEFLLTIVIIYLLSTHVFGEHGFFRKRTPAAVTAPQPTAPATALATLPPPPVPIATAYAHYGLDWSQGRPSAELQHSWNRL